MTDGYVQVQSVTTGDKKIDNSELTVGANTVERQRINISDPASASAIASVLSSAPSTGEYGITTRPLLGLVSVAVSTSGGALPVSGTVGLSSGVSVASGTPTSGQLPAALSSGGFLGVAVLQSTGTQVVSGTVSVSGVIPVASATSGNVNVSLASGSVVAITSGTISLAASQTIALTSGTVVVSGAVAVASATSGNINAQIASSSGGAITGAPAAAVPAMLVAVGISDGANSRAIKGDADGNVKVRAPGNQFRKTGTAAAATLVSINTSAAGGALRNVCQDLSFSITSTAAPTIAAAVAINLYDGTSSGTILWSMNVAMPSVAGQSVNFGLTDLWIEGSQNTAMTFFCAAPWSASIARLNFGGCTVTT